MNGQQRSSLYAAKKDDESTIDAALAYTKKVLLEYRNCYIPDRFVKKFGKDNVVAYVKERFHEADVNLTACQGGGYVINIRKEKH